MSDVNPENICAHLYKDYTKDFKGDMLEKILSIQTELQILLEQKKGSDFNNLTFAERLIRLDRNWRNFSVEYGELMDKLPYKEWKNYPKEVLEGNFPEKDWLEIKYELIDMAHFFFNMCIYMGIDAKEFFNLYISKNKENLNRQERNY